MNGKEIVELGSTCLTTGSPRCCCNINGWKLINFYKASFHFSIWCETCCRSEAHPELEEFKPVDLEPDDPDRDVDLTVTIYFIHWLISALVIDESIVFFLRRENKKICCLLRCFFGWFDWLSIFYLTNFYNSICE